MPLNFTDLFARYGVEYRVHGQDKSVRRGNLGVHCPFCGDDDGYHLGINIENGKWSCWKDPSHRGIRPERLLVALLGITWPEAKVLTEEPETFVGFKALQERAAQLFQPPASSQSLLKPQTFPDNFRKLAPKGLRHRFWNYLITGRRPGLPEAEVRAFCRRYRLRCCLSGPFGGYLILPLFLRGELVGWTSRAITLPRIAPRYRAFPSDASPKQTLFNFDHAAEGGRVLAVVEGPFDAMAIDFYGFPKGIHAVGLMTTSATPEQCGLLRELADRYDHVALVLDRGLRESRAAWELQARLCHPASRIVHIPPQYKDGWESLGDLDFLLYE